MIKFTLLPLLLAALVMAGCAYAPPIRQGNYLAEKNVAKLKTGMTRAQVRFVLGTPMVKNLFHAHRWDYIYYVQPNNGEPIERERLVVYFENGKVARIDKRDMQAEKNKTQG